MNKLYTIRKLTLSPNSRITLYSGTEYSFLLVLSGTCRVCFGDTEPLCAGVDMLLFKPEHSSVLTTEGIAEPCSLSLLRVSPAAFRKYSDENCDLSEKYRFVPYEVAIVHGEVNTVLTLKKLISRLNNLEREELQLGITIYENNLLSSFLVLFLRACAQSDQVRRQNLQKHLLIDDVFLYIQEHLTEDLSIPRLEQEFYTSGEHLTRKFKAAAGIPVHSYIVKSRIDLSKKLILQGYPIKEVYTRCGFGSYNHFFRAFKKECKITPREYYKQLSDVVRK